MTENAKRGVVHAFCDAVSSRDPGRLAAVIDDNIEWTLFGPIDLFPFFGQRRGKAAVIATCDRIADTLSFIRCEKETLLVDGSRAAGLVRLNAVDTRTGRSLSLRLALFAEFREGQLIAMKGLLDSFDAVEQALGHHIDLSDVA